MKSVDLSVIIVSYNTAQITLECIESIVRTVKKISYEIIVIDNASSDQSAASIKYYVSSIKNGKDRVTLFENKENLGFSKANNIGVSKSNGRYVLFLNSDTVVYKNTLDGMVEFMDKTPSAGAATCFVVLPNGKMDDAAHRGFPTPWRAFSHFLRLSKPFPRSKLFAGYSFGWEDLSKTHEIDALAGAFMIVRRAAGEQVRWWDEDFFWYGEDIDFCYRLKEKGWKVYFVPEYRILHYKGVSGGIKKHSKHLSSVSNDTRVRAINARFRAMEIFYHKHYKKKYPWFVTWPVLSGIKTKWFVTKLLK